MSRKLLDALNGSNKGAFREFVDGLKGEPRIAWYPSAGEDFRDLLYLNPAFSAVEPADKPEPAPPDVFLHSDYFPWSAPRFLDEHVVHHDDHTTVTVQTIEELPPVRLGLDPGIVAFPERKRATGRVVFLELEVESDALGHFLARVVYVFAENEAFCAEKMLPCGAQISHVIHVSYGGGCGGGGHASGAWLLNILPRLRCEVFVTDGHHNMQSGDWEAIRLYPELGGPEDDEGAGAGVLRPRHGGGPHGYCLECIRRMKSERWSGHGEVTWNLVIPG